MKPETLTLLKAADHPNWCECPPNFDWNLETARVRQLQPRIEKLLGCPVSLDERVQDASFFTQILCVHFSVVFSAFGNLFTIWSEDKLNKDLEKGIVTVVESEGFIYVSNYELGEIYTGINEDIQKFDPARRCTWYYRYFSYL